MHDELPITLTVTKLTQFARILSFVFLLLPFLGAGQTCSNWLYLPPGLESAVKLGDLDVPGTQITVEAEFCRTTPYSGGMFYAGDLVSKHIDPNTVNYLLRPDDAEITTTHGYASASASCDIQLNRVYHVAMTYDGASLKFYRNGVLVAQTAASGNLVQNDYNAKIGMYDAATPNESFEGYVNNVRIWNVVRTQAQIQQYMSVPLPSPTTQTGLLAYYYFDNLSNKQGNSTWNGTLVNGSQVNQNNPYCNTPATLAGTLTGSNTCNGAPGMLTYHSTSGGSGPFTITYTDGTTTYTQTNVMDGVPFNVQVQPAVSTTYTLLTIQAGADCSTSTPVTGVSASVNPNNCTLCTGSLGDPILNITFGSGPGNSPDLPTVVPGASTSLTYVAVSGNPATPTPLDGQYTITNNVPNNYTGSVWHSGSTDHTGDPNGYMLYENPLSTTGEFYRQQIDNLCGGVKYEYAAWFANTDLPNLGVNLLPNLTFIVQTLDGTVLATYNSGPIPQSAVMTWNHYGFMFELPAGLSSVIVSIQDNTVIGSGPNAVGNDFAIDDITFRPCGPTTTAAATAPTPLCSGTAITLNGSVTTGYTNPEYLWQVSTDSGKTWTDIPSSNSTQLTVTPTDATQSIDYYYRMLSAEGGNIQSVKCRVTSNNVVVTVNVPPAYDFDFVQETCNPLTLDFTGPLNTGANYSWTIAGVDYPSTTTGGASLTHIFPATGSYPVTLSASGSVCQATTTKTVDIEVTPADLIIQPDTGICLGKSVTLTTKPVLDFCWSPTTYLDNPASANPVATPSVTTKYYFTAHVPGDNLVVNGDFSAGNTGFTSAYTNNSSGFNAGVYSVGPSPTSWYSGFTPCVDHTTGSGNMLMINGSDQPNVNVWSETVPVKPYTNYIFSCWLETITTINPAQLQFSINGQPLSTPFSANAASCKWDQFYTVWNSGSATSAIISILNQNTNFSGNDFALDDIYFSQEVLEQDSVIITVDQPPTVTATPATATLCPNVPQQLQAAGSDPSLVWKWSPSTDLSDSTIANPTALAPLSTTSTSISYTVTGSTPHGCAVSANVQLTWQPEVNTDFTYQQDPCNPMQVEFDANSSAGVTYSWDINGTTYSAGGSDPSLTYTAPNPANYFVTLTGNSGSCNSSTQKILFIGITPADILQTADTGICVGQSVTLRTLPVLDFCWNPTDYMDNSSSTSPVVTPTTTTKYHFTGHTLGTNLLVNGDFSKGNTGFYSDYFNNTVGYLSGNYSVAASPNGWLPGASPCVDHTTGQGLMLLVNGSEQPGDTVWTERVNVQQYTNYAFSFWLSPFATANPAQLKVYINGHPIGALITAGTTTCGWQTYHLLWNSGNVLSADIAIVDQNTTSSGNDFGLDDLSFAPVSVETDSATIDVEIPSVSIAPTVTACPGLPVQLQASGSLNYQWTPADGLSNPDIANPVVQLPGNPDGVSIQYTVTGTSARGCTASSSATVNQYPHLLSMLSKDTLICKGDAAQLNANGGSGSYSWTPAAPLDNPGSATPLASPTVDTKFYLTLTDVNHCTEIDSQTVDVRPVAVFQKPADDSICTGFSTKLNVHDNNPGYVYMWTPSIGLDDPTAAYPVADPTATTTYTVNITDSICPAYTSTFDVKVTVKESPVITATKDNDLDCTIHSAQLHATGGISYVWMPPAGLDNIYSPDPIATTDSSTTYIVIGTAPDGCKASYTLRILVKATGANTFVVPNAFTPNGDGHNDCFGVTRWGDVQLEEMAVYDRWGARVFSSRNPSDCWDGTFKGKLQPAGAYVYVIKAMTYCGPVTKNGVVMLIR